MYKLKTYAQPKETLKEMCRKQEKMDVDKQAWNKENKRNLMKN